MTQNLEETIVRQTEIKRSIINHNKIPYRDIVMAAIDGKLDILKTFWSLNQELGLGLENDIPSHDGSVVMVSSCNGHFEIIKWLQSLKQEFGVNVDFSISRNCVLERAIHFGRFDIQKWMWSSDINVCKNSKLYYNFISSDEVKCDFEDIGEGWIFKNVKVDKIKFNHFIFDKLIEGRVTKRVFMIFFICLNRKKIHFGLEINKEIARKILLLILPSMPPHIK